MSARPEHFDLEAAIAAWRRPLETSRAFSADDVRELESHLRDHIDRLLADGATPEQAFRTARRRLGLSVEFEAEYDKTRWERRRHTGQLINELLQEARMLRNQLTLALRSMRRRPGFTAINVVGLAVGLACCLFIAVYVWHESTVDGHHENADRIYRVITSWQDGLNAARPPLEEFGAWGSAAPGPVLADEIPEVEQMVRFSGGHSTLIARDDVRFKEENYFFVDPNVFEVFDFDFVQGNSKTALERPDTIVLTESTARRYFGDTDPMGRTMIQDNDAELEVTGVIRDLPSHTHLDIDMLISMETMRSRSPDFRFTHWGYIDFYTYVMLREGTDPDIFQARLPDLFDTHMTQSMQDRDATFFMDFEPLTDVYLSPISERISIGPEGNPANLRIFSIAGIFILLIACFNFMNLSAAQSLERAREVGVRKVLGSERSGLVKQFLVESTAMTVLAAMVAAAVVVVGRRPFERLSGIDFPVGLFAEPVVVVGLVGFILLIGLFAGLYPAFVLSRFEPVRVLKGAVTRSRQGIAFRKGLVVSQFTISAVLLIGTLVVRDQIHFMQNQRLGFEQEQQLVIEHGRDAAVIDQLDSFMQSFEAHPAVESVMAARTVPGGERPNATTFIVNAEGETQEEVPQIFEVGFDFVEQLGIEVVAGRAYSRDFPSDSTQALMLNEAAAREFGYADPADIVGAEFSQWNRQGRVIGVIADFHHQSVRERIAPLTLRLAPENTTRFVLKMSTTDVRATVADIEQIWRERVPHLPFLYSFLDESFEAQYRAEARFGGMIGLFSALAIFIACLGLIGTTAYTVRRKTKEIGIRKVMGASAGSVCGLLLRDVVALFGIAIFLAVPLAWIGLDRWLSAFPYRTDVRFVSITVAAIVILAVAVAAVGYQTLRAASTRPVECLRYE